MKKTLITILFILCISILSISFANGNIEYTLTKAQYTLFTNDTKYENDELPILNYLGNTYVPLRVIVNACGASIDWRGDGNRVVIETLEENTPYLNEEIYLEGSDERKIVSVINDSIKYNNEKDIDKSMSLFLNRCKEEMKLVVEGNLNDELVKNKIMRIARTQEGFIFMVRAWIKNSENDYEIWDRDYIFEKEGEEWKLFDIH